MPIVECSVCGRAMNDRCMRPCIRCFSPMCPECAGKTQSYCLRCLGEPNDDD